MKKYKVRITDLAEQDFEEITTLASMPKRNELEEDKILSELGVRRHYYKSYKIYYMVYEQENCIVVLRILHTLVDGRTKIYRVFGR